MPAAMSRLSAYRVVDTDRPTRSAMAWAPTGGVSGSGTGGIGIQSCHHGWAVPGDRPQHVLIGCTTARLIVLSGLSGLFRYRRGLR